MTFFLRESPLLNGDLTVYLQAFRVQDVVDILLISCLIYGFTLWLKRTSSRFMMVGILLLAVVYSLSRKLQLYMTATLLQGFFAVLIFALIVIFQEDLRRFLERLALWGKIRKKSSPNVQRDVEVITLAVGNLARKKNGALIVIMGEEPLDRHIEEGVQLNGLLSQALLESIFDPSSIGHDGAVIIDRDRVLQFGCHLPLSSNAKAFGNIGLRHTAALGLSERSDALTIVVSEERGTISVAKDKNLEVLDNAPALKTVLEAHYAGRLPHEKQDRGVAGLFTRNAAEKLIAVVLALVLWVAYGYQRDVVQRDVTVPIEYRNLASDWVLEEPKAMEAKVMLMGPEQAFRLFAPSNLRISLDLNSVKQGDQQITLSSSMIKTPSNISVVGIKPERIHVIAYRLISMNVPIEVRTTGALPPGLTLDRIEAVPAFVPALVSPRAYKNGVVLKIKPLNLQDIQGTVTLSRELVVPPDVRFPDEKTPMVNVTITVHSKR